MTSTKPFHVRRRPAALLLALTFAATACGGSSGDDSAPDTDESEEVDGATAVTDPPDAEVAPIDEPTTDAPTTDAPTTTVADTTTTTTEVEVDTPEQSAAAYCDASLEYWIPNGGLSFLAIDDSVGAERAFDDLADRIQGPIDTAPNDDARQSAIDAEVVLTELTPLLAEVDFDPDRLDELDDRAKVDELIIQFGDSQNRLGNFLLEECSFVRSDLVGLALDYATSQATLPIQRDKDPLPEPEVEVEVEPTAPSGDSTSIADDTGNIEVSVPAEWTDVLGEPGPTENRLIASTDQAAFLNGFDVPGMFIEAVDTPGGNGAAAYPLALETIITNYTAGGCTLVSEEPYSDIAYTGSEALLTCVPGFETRVIAGTDSSEERIFVVAMVLVAGDTTTRDLIANTFII